jgi:hypothetical protein
MEPFGVDGGIKTLDVAPSRVLVRVRLVVGSRNGGLRFVLGEVVDD